MHIKYHLLFAVTLLVYAIGKYFHLSSLLVVLVVGLFLKNAALFNFNWFKNNFLYSKLDEDIHQMTSFTAESAFLIRTFFFLIFGYTLDLKELLDNEILMTGAGIFSIIFSIRFIYLKLISKSELLPEGFISPRGLISILLFYTIPTEKWISTKENGMLLSVIIATSIFMTLGLLIYKRKTTLA